MKNIDEIKQISKILTQTAEEVQEILSTEERDNFAIGFLKYVQDTYEKEGDLYFFSKPSINHVSRNIDEVLANFKYFLEQNATLLPIVQPNENSVEALIKTRNERLINSLQKEINCVHTWNPYGMGYQCEHCNFYTGLNTELNQLIKQLLQ
jgi:hypothetical protein